MKYGAITIDTSVFEHYGHSFDTEPLKSLEQFKDKPIGLILVDVVHRELQDHLAKKMDDHHKALGKASRVAKVMNLDPDFVKAFDQVIDSVNPRSIAEESLDSFIDSTGTVLLSADEFVTVEQLLHRYFRAQAPFAASGKKKSEFPDAICLLALETYAKKNDIKVLAVSGDGDWRDFAEQSDWIDFENNLSDAIAHFHPQKTAFNFCHDFVANWCANKYKNFLSEISSHIENEVDGFEFDVDANSALEWEISDLTIRLESVEILESGDPEADIKVINLDEDFVTFKVQALLACLAEGEFGLSIYDRVDRDYARLGSASSTTRPEIEVELFVRVTGDLDGPIAELDIESVDVVPKSRLLADFGFIEPSWHGDDLG